MEKTCPKCGAKFECNHDNIGKCWCVENKLTKEQLDYLSNNYNGCLCPKCMKELKEMTDFK